MLEVQFSHAREYEHKRHCECNAFFFLRAIEGQLSYEEATCKTLSAQLHTYIDLASIRGDRANIQVGVAQNLARACTTQYF